MLHQPVPSVVLTFILLSPSCLQDKGHVVSNSTTLRAVHNSFARSDPFSIDPSLSSSSEKEDAYHFVTYLPVAGSLYELDGLQSAPRRHGAVKEGGQQWMEEARKVVRERIESYPMGAVRPGDPPSPSSRLERED